MPSIPLDTKHWTRVAPGPEDESITVTPRGFACYYTNEAEPPEKASEGTEAGTGTGVTFETTRWFRAKEPGSTETPIQPSILEVSQATAGEGAIDTAEIANEAVTTAKVAAKAVTGAKTATDLTGFRLFKERSIVIKEAEAESKTEATAFLLTAVGTQVQATASVVKYGVVVPDWFFWRPSDWAIVGKTTKMVLQVDALTAKAPAATITFNLYQVHNLAEVTKQTEVTIEASRANVKFTTPAAKSALRETSTAFTPAETALYTLGFELSVATAAESLVVANLKLYVSNA